MIMIIVAVRDAKSEAFGIPHFVQTVGAGVRSFSDEVNRQGNSQMGNVMYDHPGDFQLFALGKYDDQTGEFVGETPRLLISGNECRQLPDSIKKVSKV